MQWRNASGCFQQSAPLCRSVTELFVQTLNSDTVQPLWIEDVYAMAITFALNLGCGGVKTKGWLHAFHRKAGRWTSCAVDWKHCLRTTQHSALGDRAPGSGQLSLYFLTDRPAIFSSVGRLWVSMLLCRSWLPASFNKHNYSFHVNEGCSYWL